MLKKLSVIANKYNLQLKIIKLPDKIRAFIVEVNCNTYIIINENLSDSEKEKAFYT